jgi:ribonucleoside-triphosphate reductase
VRKALTNFHLPYITVTPTFSICPVHGYLAGEHEFCPRCDEEVLARKQRQAFRLPAKASSPELLD